MTVRQAVAGDVPRLVELVEQRRAVYQRYEPVFWRKAEDSAVRTVPFFTSQLTNPRAIVLTAEADGWVAGFLIAIETPEPPVYEPGGPTVLVDDFCVADRALWSTVGRALLNKVRVIGKEGLAPDRRRQRMARRAQGPAVA